MNKPSYHKRQIIQSEKPNRGYYVTIEKTIQFGLTKEEAQKLVLTYKGQGAYILHVRNDGLGMRPK